VILPSSGDADSGDDNHYVGNNDTLVVQTSYGSVRGFYYNVTNYWDETTTTVRAWRGMPFASPPVDEQRWMPPIAPASWNDTLSCLEFQPECVQSDGSGSEDCLYLNIYTSVLNDQVIDKGPWPVYFDIYGGGLTGGAATSNYNGLINSLAAKERQSGLVIVAPAYRLNMFGFLAISSLTKEQNGTSGNYGILDQIAALKWVQENIAAFNGDPKNVIIGGFSSGGTSAFALLSSPSSKGLFHAAMSYSGSTNLTMTLENAIIQNQPIVNASGCNILGYTYEEINSCLRNLSIAEVVALIPASWSTPGMWGLPLGPNGQQYAGLVIVDGTYITQSFTDALASGLVDVPFLFGNMGMEPDESPDIYVGDYNEIQWYDLLNSTFSTWPNSQTVTDEMFNLYYNDSIENPQKAYDRIVADYGLYCSQIILSKNALSPNGQRQSPIYIYYDEWQLEKTFTGYNGTPVRYAFHALFYLQLTDQWNWIGNGTYIPTHQDLESQQTIQNNVFSFFLDHRPTSDWSAVNETENWPSSYVLYDLYPNEPASKVNYRSNICQQYESMGSLIYPSYWWCD
jgi:carboxylesterase type B